MDIKSWLRARRPSPPERLVARMEAALGKTNATTQSGALVEAAAKILEDLARHGANDRSAAIDLLAADALITYAIEAAIEDVATFPEQTDAMIARVAETAST
jgi:hypothetical protein